MVEAIVSYAVEKLGDLMGKEAQLLGGVGDEVRRVEKTLKDIWGYLKVADTKTRRGDELVEGWLNGLRDVAYRIEDAIDIFYVEHDQSDNHIEENVEGDINNINSLFHRAKNSLFHRAKKMKCEIKEVPSLRKLGKEVADIQEELDEIFKRKEMFDITSLPNDDVEGRGSHRQSQQALMINRRPAYEDVDETEIVGLNAHKDNILQLLDRPQRRAVITIVGVGGIGKTTLARSVYDRLVPIFHVTFLF